ncbi:hypothetical protein [Hyphomicrobium sp.]|uniref:hypothetical protein n=1 Tax=Hyphomicrobium sp. TaxID=82 RepID=UPI001D28C136|nr:hypothetical protein [Hyphomicrobium sp.]MBY0560022.1 hypothetical protein [Hyphomicrobium sp.]
MAIRFFDGLGSYKTTAELSAAKNSILSGATAINTSGGRFGGGCVTVGPPASNPLTINFASALNTPIYVGAAVNFIQDASLSARNFMNFFSSGGAAMGYVGGVPATGQLYVGNKSNVIQGGITVGNALQPNSWHWLEVRFVPGSTTSNGSIAVHVDGLEVLNVTGIDTNRGTETLGSILFGGIVNSTSSGKVDDLVIWDETGDVANTWLGDIRIDELVPTSNGADQDWAANTGPAWDAVNDTPSAADDDTTYIASSTVDAKSSFNIAPLSGVSAAVYGVKVRARSKKSDAGAKTVKTLMKSGSTEVLDAAAVDPTTAYNAVHGDMKLVNPDTSAVWDDASVNALKIGVAVAS